MTKKMMFECIDTEEKLEICIDDLSEQEELGVDIECENNLHNYGVYICLIQISTTKNNYIIDPLALKGKMGSLKDVFENPKIVKIFHDTGFDLRILKKDLDIAPKNIFDSEVAANLIGEEQIGLGSLLEKYFGIKKEKKFQKYDWTRRPIGEDMLEYAVKDSAYLIEMKKIFLDKLADMGRLEWIKEENQIIEKRDNTTKEFEFENIKGYKALTDSQRALMKRFFLLREKLAQKVNKPTYFIIRNKQLMEIVINPLKSASEFKSQRFVHPIFKRHAERFVEEQKKAETEKIVIPKIEIKRMTEQQKEKMLEMADIRDKYASKLEIQKHLVLTQDQIKESVINNSYENLKKWQQELLKADLDKLF